MLTHLHTHTHTHTHEHSQVVTYRLLTKNNSEFPVVVHRTCSEDLRAAHCALWAESYWVLQSALWDESDWVLQSALWAE